MDKDMRANKEVAALRKKVDDLEWGIKRTNDAIKALYRELAEKNAELRKYDKLKSQFVANVSHEYKSPLAIIKEYSLLVHDGVVGEVNDEQKEFLKYISDTVDRLNRLVMDTLDLSKIESGKMVLSRELFDINLLAGELIVSHSIIAKKKKVKMISRLGHDPIKIWADKDKVYQLINNLVNNAIKYTPKNGVVTVSLRNEGANIRFEVEDTGPGIPQKECDKVFDKYVRIKAEKQEGTGLGLPIAKEIVELHKGTIWLESEVGKGSKFIFTIPCDLRRKNK